MSILPPYSSSSKYLYKPLLLLLLATATATLTRAQQFGGNPPSIQWNQINTKAAKVIYPRGLDSAAMEVANIVQQMNSTIQPTIGYKQKQISIVLQNQTTIANAYVGLAPFRSEFFLTPEQNSFDIGSLPWPKQLAIHEFRHVQQYNNFNVGASKIMRILFGEGGQALANDLAVPNWFFEGDAVFNETLVSNQGRGRLPYFFNGYRATWADGKNYSYMKLRNGSYLDYTPDWYPTGYMLVSYGREKYGDTFWKSVTHDAAAYRGGFSPLQRAVKKYSGEDFNQFRRDGFNYFKKQFSNDVKPLSANSIVKSQHFVADEEFPAYVNDTTLIYMKGTYNHLPVFVIKSGNTERNISVRSVSLDNYFAYNNGKVVYATYRPDVRWTYRDFSELVVLDIKTGKEKRISHNTKYFSPSFGPDGKTIVAVQVNPSGRTTIHLVNSANGKFIKAFGNPEKQFYTYPKYYGKDRLIAAVRNQEGKMSLVLIDIATEKVRYLLPFSYQPIGFINVRNDIVYFTATSGINDRLYALYINSGKLYELKNEQQPGYIGNYQPAVSDKKFALVGFTAVGYQISELDKKDLKWEEAGSAIPGSLSDMGITSLGKNPASDLLATVKPEPLEVTKYPKAHHLFNFHSIIPNLSDPNYQIAIVGENVLNTFQSQLAFTYNRDEQYKQFGFDAVYGALFPYLKAGVDYAIDRRGLYKNGSNVYWNETDLHGGLEVPLNFSQGKNITGLDVGSALYYTQNNFQAPYSSILPSRSYLYVSNYVVFSNHIQRARQNIYPRFGQSLTLSYKSAVSSFTNDQFLADANLFFPGLSINHNLVINAAYQQKDGNNGVSFSNNFPFSRGYFAENLHKMDKLGVDYHLPIAYPDAGIGNTIYLLRLRGDLFYDYTYASYNFPDGSRFKNFRSTGAAIFLDTQWFNQVPISFGFRYNYLMDQDFFGYTGRNRFEIILPVAFF